ncbi:MAG: hypothetical protein R3Y56_08710 [Akkermansia sp.]
MRRLLILSLPLLLLACQNQTSPDGSSDDPQEEKKPAPIYIGTIQQVYPDHNFALVRLARMVPKTGTTLISHPADGTNLRLGNLCVSAEKIDNSVSRMIAADIRGGTVVRGDAVYIYDNVLAQRPKKQVITEDTPITAEDAEFLADPVASVAHKQEAVQEGDDITPPWFEEDSSVAPIPAPAITAPNKLPAGTKKSDPSLPSFIEDIPDRIEEWDDM